MVALCQLPKMFTCYITQKGCGENRSFWSFKVFNILILRIEFDEGFDFIISLFSELRFERNIEKVVSSTGINL